MAKKSKIIKQKKRKKMVDVYAVTRSELKKTIDDATLPFDVRLKAMQKLSELSRNSSKTRLHNRCSLTGRPHAFYRYFGISRIVLRNLANAGLIPGLKKSSW
jgi:small subunit ribosomal protein S14